ncbi:MAG TPA: CDGSH iron-sulfur domain-containing protein [Thermoanaerobaculia bacterium]|nr:CDGSH iron-sulfur domain-containing protein [Thermoanaerobaculia bacterium]
MSVTIKVSENGPFIVEGEFTLVDAGGNVIEAKKRALCRCGGSTMKPFCDGMHSKLGFKGANAAVESGAGEKL